MEDDEYDEGAPRRRGTRDQGEPKNEHADLPKRSRAHRRTREA